MLKNSATIILKDGYLIMTYYDETSDVIKNWSHVKKFLDKLIKNHSQKEIYIIIEEKEGERVLSSHAANKVVSYLKEKGVILDIHHEYLKNK